MCSIPFPISKIFRGVDIEIQQAEVLLSYNDNVVPVGQDKSQGNKRKMKVNTN